MPREAQAFFVFVNKYDSVQLMHEEDMEAILSTLAVKRFRANLKVIVELNSEKSKSWLEAYHLPHVQAICLEELRNGLLAHSCLYPGLSTRVCVLGDSACAATRAATYAAFWLRVPCR